MEQTINWDRVESVYNWLQMEDRYMDNARWISHTYPNDEWENETLPPLEKTSPFDYWEPNKPPFAIRFITNRERNVLLYCYRSNCHPNVLRIMMDKNVKLGILSPWEYYLDMVKEKEANKCPE